MKASAWPASESASRSPGEAVTYNLEHLRADPSGLLPILYQDQALVHSKGAFWFGVGAHAMVAISTLKFGSCFPGGSVQALAPASLAGARSRRPVGW